MSTKVKDWYVSEYPSDDLGEEIDSNIDFSSLYKAMISGKDFYDVIGVGDSVIRERVFERLANILNVHYSYIYDRWIGKPEGPVDLTPQEHIEMCLWNNFDILPNTSKKKLRLEVDKILEHIGFNVYSSILKDGVSKRLESLGKKVILLYATRNNTDQERKIIFNNITL